MSYLTSADDTPGGAGRTKVDTYVLKQAAWAKEVAAYQHAQAQALERQAPPPGATTAQIKASQEKYNQWLQEHARDHKNKHPDKVHGLGCARVQVYGEYYLLSAYVTALSFDSFRDVLNVVVLMLLDFC